MYTPERGTINLTQKELDKIWDRTQKVGKLALDPETKWLVWDKEMRAHALGFEQLSKEGQASLEGPTFFGVEEEVRIIMRGRRRFKFIV